MDQTAKERLNTFGTVITYLIIGGLWILFSDKLLVMVVKDTETWIRVQLFKGWFYILITSIILWILIRRGKRALSIEDKRGEDLRGRQQVTESLRGILEILNSDIDLPEVLDYIVIQASELLGADATAIYQLQRPEELLVIQASLGLDEDYVARANIPLGQAITGRAVLEKKAIHIADLKAHLPNSSFVLDERRQELIVEVAEHYRAIMAVPLVSNTGEVYGSLTLYYRSSRDFSNEDVALAESFATQVSLGTDNALLRRQVERNAIIEERTRIAREIHDSISQSIYSASLYVDATLLALSSGKENTVKENLNELQAITREAMLDMRLLIFELHPPILEKDGLVAAVQARLESVEARSGVKTTLQAEGERRLPTDVEFELYRIIQEALTNTVKHAGASEVGVKLFFTENNIHLEIWDNGVGFETSASENSGGLGLGNITNRVALINGMFSIQSAAGKGTVLIIDIDV